MYQVRLQQVGDGLGIVISDKECTRLGLSEGDSLILTETPEGLRLTRYDKDFKDAMVAAERGMRKFGRALRKLAE